MHLKHLIFALSLVLLAGCTRLGEEVERGALPPGMPEPVAVLAQLAANEAAIAQFKATGEFTLQSPDIAGVQSLHQSTFYFRPPADLHVVGRKYTSVVMKLSCAGNAFVLEFPTEKEYMHREQGEYVLEVDAQVTPAWIAREMFRPEDWSGVEASRLRVLDYNEAEQRMTLAVMRADSEKTLLRQLVLSGPPWVILKNELFAPDGTLIAVTEKGDYRDMDGLLFPAQVSATFPQTGASMSLSMRKIFLNEVIDDSLFDLDKTLKHLQAENYVQVQDYETIKNYEEQQVTP